MNSCSAACSPAVFDRPLHLAGVLDDAADALDRTWLGYEWNDRTRCNCGIVARQVLQATPAQLAALLPPIYDNGVFRPSWRSMTEVWCTESGLERNEVFARLMSAGLCADDFVHLEDLAHPEIQARMEPLRRAKGAVRRSRKSDVIAYLRAWATGIEACREGAATTDFLIGRADESAPGTRAGLACAPAPPLRAE